MSNTNFARGIHLESAGCLNDANPGVGFFKIDFEKIYYFDHNNIKTQHFTYVDGQELESYIEYSFEDYPSPSSTDGDQFLRSKKTNSFANTDSALEESYEENYTYVFDESTSEYSSLLTQNYLRLVQTDISKNNEFLSSSEVNYDSFNGKILPKSQSRAKDNLTNFEEALIIDDYISNERVLRSHVPDGVHTYYAYDGQYLIFKVEGLYQSSFSYLNTRLHSINNDDLTLEEKVELQKEVIDHYPNHIITAYTYKPDVGVTSITDASKNTRYYEYDASERLIKIRDGKGMIIDQYIYNYKSN